MLVIQKRTSISIKTRPDKYFTNLILCDGSLRREEVVADPVSKAHVFNRFLSPENSFKVVFLLGWLKIRIVTYYQNGSCLPGWL